MGKKNRKTPSCMPLFVLLQEMYLEISTSASYCQQNSSDFMLTRSEEISKELLNKTIFKKWGRNKKNTQLQKSNFRSYQNSKSSQKNHLSPPAPVFPTASRNEHTVKLKHHIILKTRHTHQSMFQENWKKTAEDFHASSHHFQFVCVCKQVRLQRSAPMQTQLFLKSSCPFISYFNRYRPCQIRERHRHNMESRPAGAEDQRSLPDAKQRSTHQHSHVLIQD